MQRAPPDRWVERWSELRAVLHAVLVDRDVVLSDHLAQLHQYLSAAVLIGAHVGAIGAQRLTTRDVEQWHLAMRARGLRLRDRRRTADQDEAPRAPRAWVNPLPELARGR